MNAGRGTSVAADPDALLLALEADLQAKRFWLEFSPEIERRYIGLTNATRLRRFFRFAGAGLVIFNLFLITDAQMMPDVLNRAAIQQLGIITPFALVTIAMIWRRKELLQLPLTVLMIMISANTVSLLLYSNAAGSALVPFSFPLVLMSGNVMLPLRFRWATAFTAISAVMLTAAVLTHAPYDTTMREFILLLVLSTGGYTLVAGYRIEENERAAYLLTLRETLRSEALALSNRRLRDLSDTDGLTGIGNRRFFDVELDRLWQEAPDKGQPVGLLLIDIDHFKALNDRYGHQAGDRCLLLVADVLRLQTRESLDLAARYGGEEFAIVLPGSLMSRAQQIAERLRRAVEDLAIPLDGPAVPGNVRVSVGCASMMPDATNAPAALIAAADAALYRAKRGGRNCIFPPIVSLASTMGADCTWGSADRQAS